MLDAWTVTNLLLGLAIGSIVFFVVMNTLRLRKHSQRKVAIYVLTDPVTMEVRYVGQTVSPRNRLKQHLEDARPYGTPKQRWIYSLKVKGLEPKMRVIDEVTWKKRNDAEKIWIQKHLDGGARLVNTVHVRRSKRRGAR